jgi:hypothetical protein
MFATTMAVVLAAAPVPKGPAEPAEAVKARAAAVAWLLKQARDGAWDATAMAPIGAQYGTGINALATAALLESGVSPAADPVDAALARLAADKTEFTYTVALRIVALAKADSKKHRLKIQADADWLAKTAVRKNGQLVGWSYPAGAEGRTDGSNTQYAIMALSVVADAGAKVDPALWADVRELYVRTRRPGGWQYTNPSPGRPTQTMTAAALCGLYLADRHLGKPDKEAIAAREAGLADWVKRYGTEDGQSVFYQWHGTARLGGLVGKESIPGPDGKAVNWYTDGVAWLAKHQNEDGSWGRSGLGKGVDADRVIATSFGLLFLGPPKR